MLALARGAAAVTLDRSRERPTCSKRRCPRREPSRSPAIRPCSAAPGWRGWRSARAETRSTSSSAGSTPTASRTSSGRPSASRSAAGRCSATSTSSPHGQRLGPRHRQPQHGRRRRPEPARVDRPGADARPRRPLPLLRRRSRLPGRHARRPECLSPVDDPLSPDADRRDGADRPLCRERLRGPRRTPARPALSRGGGRADAPGKCRRRWRPAPASLLPPSITYVPDARAEDGRWFVQAYGEFALQGQARLSKPADGPVEPPRRARRAPAPARRPAADGLHRAEPRPHRRHERRREPGRA